MSDAPPAKKQKTSMESKSYPFIQLNTGAKMPMLGLGTFLASPGEVGAAVVEALKAGYKHIDCAAAYTNEQEVGQAFASVFNDPSSGIKREDIFITSKLPTAKATPEDVESLLKQTLADLQLEYLDLYLIHAPFVVEPDPTYDGKDRIKGKFKPRRSLGWGLQDLWRAMEGCHKAGLAKAIGVSNYNAQALNDLLMYAAVPPAVNQIERHPFFQQNEFVAFNNKWGVQITAYAPLGAPGLYGASREESLLSSALVNKIASAHGKTAAQILIRWAIDTNTVVIPKSSKPHRIRENFNVLDFTLSAEELSELASLEKNDRLFLQDWMGIPTFQ